MMRKILKIRKRFGKPVHKSVALIALLSILFQLSFPTFAFALTGGPSQPETQSFEPVSTSDMVDPFSGGFTYNIPLLNVDGYPINISYHSGISMDQEASWVGLGWNINPGCVSRNVRGIPDDFEGDTIQRDFNMKENTTWGVSVGAGLKIFGLPKSLFSGSLQASLGVHYNNYNGVGTDLSVTLSVTAGASGKSPLTGSLGLDANSENGVSVAPSLGLSCKLSDADGGSVNLGASVGTAFNTRHGLQSLTIGTSVGITTDPSKDANGNITHQGGDISGPTTPSAHFNFMQSTYTPQVTMSMTDLSITGNFRLGFEGSGAHPNFNVGGYYTTQSLTANTVYNPAYGYMHADEGVQNPSAMMDFNREKDGAFTSSTPDLPLANFTYDIFTVSGQGAGGSYRPFRGDIGHVFDPYNVTTSQGNEIGVDVGIGDIFHAGVDVTANTVNTSSGDWSMDNNSMPGLSFASSAPGNPTYEPVYFKEASEKSVESDPSFFQKEGGLNPERVALDQIADFYTVATNTYESGLPVAKANYRQKRDIRNQSISMLTRGQLQTSGLEDPTTLNLFPGARPHHIAEITSLGTDGKRYVYGIAAYNTKKKEVTFAAGENASDVPGDPLNGVTGLVTYSGSDNTTGNTEGIDNYYSGITTPPYAHSYLLTAVLSPDYVDADSIRGPSNGDLGTWTKFNYTKQPIFKWRVPVGDHTATYNEGFKSDPTSPKANYIYGEKELWYLNSIETKNYIAVFTTKARLDGLGVNDENGSINTDTSYAPRMLTTISLYTKPNYNAYLANPSSTTLVPIEQVHFVYNYSLCPNVPNNYNVATGSSSSNTGKLTLTKIYFTYQNSFKGELSPYVFNYSSFNPGYSIKAYDRWGFYKADSSTSYAYNALPPPAEYSYVDQNKAEADQNASAWTMTDVIMPSGGDIHIDYESNDYASVQNLPAMQMAKIEAATPTSSNISIPARFTSNLLAGNFPSDPKDVNYVLVFPLQNDQNGNPITNIPAYFNGISNLYFRFLMMITPGNYEYVSGYAPIDSMGVVSTDNHYGWVKLQGTALDGNGSGIYSPILRTAIQYAIANRPRLVFNEPLITQPAGLGVFQALLSSITQFSSLVTGLNGSIYIQNYCNQFITDKSFIRVNNVTGRKFGGGPRVKDIMTNDEWSVMTNNQEKSFDYGQQYIYTLADGVTSSGVASYEPQLGGDENPWRQPVFYSQQNLWIADDKHYMEQPFGESFFPSASVGYSRVTVKNLQRSGVHRDATGTVVHEFYTTADFPTITQQTDLKYIEEKTDPFSLSSLLFMNTRDYMTASEGYTIILNDMNGKPKAQYVYQEDQTEPISSVEYYYQSTPYQGANSYHVNNSVTTINPDGSLGKANIGVFYDEVADFRQSQTSNISSSLQLNVDDFFIGPLPVPIPTIWPSLITENTRFRSNVITKVINTFGILDSTVVKDLGSTVKTENLAYDAQTGQVLLTKTTNDFDDSIFNLTYPAYWYYGGMGQAYQNIGLALPNIQFTNGSATVNNASALFYPGDEIALTITNSKSPGVMAWITSVNGNSITAELKNGTKVSNSYYNLEVTRSGRRNMQMMDMAKLTTLVNPINSLQANSYQKVTQASAKEYTDSWGTYCNCFDKPSMETDNPYVLGVKGNYRLKTSLLYLTPRDQSSFDNNTNIRQDGTFASYNPFYSDSSGYWNMTPDNWTYTSEVTNFNPYGQEIEDVDALGRYSSATFGYNQTLPTSVAANSQYKEQGFDGFEDYAFGGCADNHLDVNRSAVTLDATQSHTGRHSLLVGSTPVVIGGQMTNCAPYNPCNISLCAIDEDQDGEFNLALRPSGGVAPYNFNYNVVSGNATVSLQADGSLHLISYTAPFNAVVNVTVADEKGCKYQTTVTLSESVENSESGYTITGGVNTNCPPCNISLCDSVGNYVDGHSIYLKPSGGTAPYSYNYTYRYGTNVTYAVSGNYLIIKEPDDFINFSTFVTVTDANGCSYSTTVDGIYGPVNNPSFTVTGVTPCSVSNCNVSMCSEIFIDGDIDSVELVPSGGVAPYTYNYTITQAHPNTNVTNSSGNLFFTTIDWQKYSSAVTVTDSKGCSADSTLNVKFTDNIPVVTGVSACSPCGLSMCYSTISSTINSAYFDSITVFHASGGAPPYIFIVTDHGTDLDGMGECNIYNGIQSGADYYMPVSTRGCFFDFTITVVDHHGCIYSIPIINDGKILPASTYLCPQ
ncbi:MAG: hypothetical protein ACLQQ4_17320 [Bacteroidia bacterium]